MPIVKKAHVSVRQAINCKTLTYLLPVIFWPAGSSVAFSPGNLSTSSSASSTLGSPENEEYILSFETIDKMRRVSSYSALNSLIGESLSSPFFLLPACLPVPRIWSTPKQHVSLFGQINEPELSPLDAKNRNCLELEEVRRTFCNGIFYRLVQGSVSLLALSGRRAARQVHLPFFAFLVCARPWQCGALARR